MSKVNETDVITNVIPGSYCVQHFLWYIHYTTISNELVSTYVLATVTDFRCLLVVALLDKSSAPSVSVTSRMSNH